MSGGQVSGGGASVLQPSTKYPISARMSFFYGPTGPLSLMASSALSSVQVRPHVVSYLVSKQPKESRFESIDTTQESQTGDTVRFTKLLTYLLTYLECDGCVEFVCYLRSSSRSHSCWCRCCSLLSCSV